MRILPTYHYSKIIHYYPTFETKNKQKEEKKERKEEEERKQEKKRREKGSK